MKREDLGKAQSIINQMRELELWKQNLRADNPEVTVIIHYHNLRASFKNGCILSELGLGLIKAPSAGIEIDFLNGFQNQIQLELERLSYELDGI
jgi:hypothetical protein